MPASNSGTDAFIWAIGQQESGGNYNIQDSSAGAVGKYQLLPSNIVAWSREMGNPVTVAQFRASPQIQDAVAGFKLRQYVNKYGYAGAAAAWYSGSPNPNSNAGNPPVHQYVSDVLGRMAKYPGGTTGTGQLGLGQAPNIETAANPLNPMDWIKAFTGAVGVGDIKDMFQRLGLIMLGGILVLVGIHILGAPMTEKAKSVVKEVVTGSGGGEASGEAGEAAKAGRAGKAATAARVIAV